MNQKLSEWASIAEIVASVAILVTLGILVLEVRQNTATVLRQSQLERSRVVNSDMISSTELPSILAKIKDRDGHRPVVQAFMDEYGLTAEESIRWTRHLGLVWSTHQADFYAGIPGLEDRIQFGHGFPDGELYWRLGKDAYDPQFVQWVDENVLDSK